MIISYHPPRPPCHPNALIIALIAMPHQCPHRHDNADDAYPMPYLSPLTRSLNASPHRGLREAHVRSTATLTLGYREETPTETKDWLNISL